MKKALNTLKPLAVILLLSFLNQSIALAGLWDIPDGFIGSSIRVLLFLFFCLLCFGLTRGVIRRNYPKVMTRDGLLSLKGELKYVALTYLIIVAAFFVYNQLVTKSTASTSQLIQVLNQKDGLALVLLLLALNVTQPLLEEMVFRGMLIEYFRPYSLWGALIISSLIFGFVHDGLLFSQQLFAGLALGSLYLYRDNIYACMLVHVLVNLTVTIINLQ